MLILVGFGILFAKRYCSGVKRSYTLEKDSETGNIYLTLQAETNSHAQAVKIKFGHEQPGSALFSF